MNIARWLSLFLFFLLALSGCHRKALDVHSIGQPVYPVGARLDHTQGTVQLGLEVGVDGRVLWAHGSGAPPILVEAAEKNGRDWIFGPLAPEGEYPFYVEVSYVFRLEGHPVYVATAPPRVRTHLPKSIEVISTPMESDFPAVAPEPKRAPGSP